MKSKIQNFDPRQTMKSEDFEIFHYYDPRTMDVEVHHHDFYEVYFFIKGSVEYWVEGQLYKLEPGDMLLINPMELHRPIIDMESNAYERIVLWINRDYLNSLSTEDMKLARCFDTQQPTHINIIRPANTKYSSIVEKLTELVSEIQGKESGYRLAAQGIFLQFMVELNRIVKIEEKNMSNSKKGSNLVSQVLSYINEHCNEEMSLEGIAKKFYISKYYLSHEFSRETGVSVYRYIMLKRLLNAKQMLSTGVAAGEVCYKCGFKDYAGFYRAFKAEYGINPRTFANGQD